MDVTWGGWLEGTGPSLYFFLQLHVNLHIINKNWAPGFCLCCPLTPRDASVVARGAWAGCRSQCRWSAYCMLHGGGVGRKPQEPKCSYWVSTLISASPQGPDQWKGRAGGLTEPRPLPPILPTAITLNSLPVQILRGSQFSQLSSSPELAPLPGTATRRLWVTADASSSLCPHPLPQHTVTVSCLCHPGLPAPVQSWGAVMALTRPETPPHRPSLEPHYTCHRT